MNMEHLTTSYETEAGCDDRSMREAVMQELDAEDDGVVRKFATGATRDTNLDKLDFESFLSPAVLRRFAEYMHAHRYQRDGTMRSGDNWQKGMPDDVYLKSAMRHFMDWWLLHRGQEPLNAGTDMEEALCALLFNVQGRLHSLLIQRDRENKRHQI